ncbi:hypothetical protein ABH941_007444 [Streptacidiphilus sp. EB103A]
MYGQLARTGIPALALGPLFVSVWAVGAGRWVTFVISPLGSLFNLYTCSILQYAGLATFLKPGAPHASRSRSASIPKRGQASPGVVDALCR